MSERSEIRNAAFAACPDTGCDWSSFYRGWLAAREAYGYAAIEAERERLTTQNRITGDMLETLLHANEKLHAERNALAAEQSAPVENDAFFPGSLADLLFQLGEKGVGVSGGTHGDRWRVSLPRTVAAQSAPVRIRMPVRLHDVVEETDFPPNYANGYNTAIDHVLALNAAQSAPAGDREAFEAWHADAYGPQSEFNSVRSLEWDDLGYVDCTVQAQFHAYCWATRRAAQQRTQAAAQAAPAGERSLQAAGSDCYAVAEQVRTALDRQACPNVWMVIAYEAVVAALAQPEKVAHSAQWPTTPGLSAAPAQPAVHPDDAAVDRFAAAMKAKLAKAREKGRGGWEDPAQCSVEFLAKLLVEHIGKGNAGTFEDVANFAMMLHQRGADPQVLAAASSPAQPEVQRLRPVLAMVLQALDRDAAEGKAARGEMAAELRAALAASTGQEVES